MRDNNDINFKVDLRKPLTRSEQKKIKRYFDVIAEIRSSSTPIARYKGKNKKQVAKLSGQNTRLKGINGVLYPKYTAESKLGFDKEGAFVKTGKLKLTTHFFDPVEIAERGIDYIIEKLEREFKPRRNHIAFYRMLTGSKTYETQTSYETGDARELVGRWFRKYGNGDNSGTLNRKRGQRTNDWLIGVRRTEFPLSQLQSGQNTLMQQENEIAKGRSAAKKRYRAVLKEAENKRKRKKNKRVR